MSDPHGPRRLEEQAKRPETTGTRTTSVDLALGSLAEVVNGLEQREVRLRNRLGPVLVEPDADAVDAEIVAPQYTTPLANKIAVETERLHEIADRLEYLLTRLDL